MINRDIIILVQNEYDRERLSRLFEYMGYTPLFVSNLNELFKILEKIIPLTVFILESTDPAPEIIIREIKRITPLLPVNIIMKEKNHIKKEKYTELGVFDTIETPWTSENILEIIKKIENYKFESNIKNETITKNIILIGILAISLISMVIFFISHIKQKDKDLNRNQPLTMTLPSKNISGYFKKQNKLYIYDWLIQSFYTYNTTTDKLENVRLFKTSKIGIIVKDMKDFFAFVNDEYEIEKRLKDENFTLISKIKFGDRIDDLCYDNMYIWMLSENNLYKMINNDRLTTTEVYTLDKNKNIKYIACSKYKLYFYTPSQILYSHQEKPDELKFYSESPSRNIIYFDYEYDNENFIYISTKGNKSELKITRIPE